VREKKKERNGGKNFFFSNIVLTNVTREKRGGKPGGRDLGRKKRGKGVTLILLHFPVRTLGEKKKGGNKKKQW